MRHSQTTQFVHCYSAGDHQRVLYAVAVRCRPIRRDDELYSYEYTHQGRISLYLGAAGPHHKKKRSPVVSELDRGHGPLTLRYRAGGTGPVGPATAMGRATASV